MKSSTLRTFQTVHTWTGLVAGFALFVAFYAGALSVFHDDIALWQNPPWRAAGADVSLDTLARRMVEAHPQARDDFGLVLAPRGTTQAPYAYWVQDGEARFATAAAIAAPSTGDPARGSLADFVYALHYSLGIPTVGLYLMGVVSLLYGLALVSGLIIHLPQLLGDLFALRAGRNLKRLWQDAHNAIGVLSLPFHLIFAVTGAILCLSTLALAALNPLAFDGKLSEAYARATTTAPARPAGGAAAPMLPPETLVERARAAALRTGVSSFEPDYIHYMHYGDRNAVVEVRGLSQRTLGTFGTVALDGADGTVLSVHVGARQDANGIVNSSMYALHFGSFGGRAVQWLYGLLGLAGAFLFYSGNLLWIESRRRRRHAEQPRRVRAMARATVGVCVGSCLGISAAFVATLLAGALGADPALPQQWACYGGFALACLYAGLRPVPRATPELLLATALLTALAALLDLARNAGVWLQPWSHATAAVFAVDLAGLALAAGFAGLARASWRRARHGEPNHVWALAAEG
ncbi:PepSY-associated TM helix domain-containing protein [Fulvimonas soli]|jgi:uncharacterized iron-regulated membrane protein|uniref:Putative iron-regulated membrane protein n=1 Tax=Fulvimonas soli TaxID=155197 RepID=A0A316I6B0_9GAMM|nr:PepSY-associated TM helix domain-containing protein [Fulvimonas soli]PWK82727.1 putative iron-regulated membrane protein [Fulvimonas soli]TNY26108.1 hypothetical protein BV497_10455 [Fulvimonas soli]